MPILNYTTKIETRRTATEIADILADVGAQGVLIEYDKERQPVALTFRIEVESRLVAFRLPSKWLGVYNLLCKDRKVERKFKSQDQAKRVAWRIIKNWTEAQLAIVQAQAAELAEVFLPYAVNPHTDRTLYDEFKGGNLLGSGDDVVDGEYREG